jgi:hypothetical protein
MEFIIKKTIRKYNIWDNFFVESTMKYIILPIILILTILASIFLFIYDYIKEKIFKIEKKEYKNVPDILIENDRFKLTKEPIMGGIEEYKMASDFLYSFVDYDDAIEIFKVVNNSNPTELDNEYLTGLFIELDNEIIMQRIKYNEKTELTSDLVGFNPKNGKINSYTEVGIYFLDKFDKKNKIIKGWNKTEEIQLMINKAIA